MPTLLSSLSLSPLPTTISQVLAVLREQNIDVQACACRRMSYEQCLLSVRECVCVDLSVYVPFSTQLNSQCTNTQAAHSHTRTHTDTHIHTHLADICANVRSSTRTGQRLRRTKQVEQDADQLPLVAINQRTKQHLLKAIYFLIELRRKQRQEARKRASMCWKNT